jgi:ferritin-like metal-binding protein YciE
VELRELFVKTLGEVLGVEQTLERDVLPQLAGEASHEKLREALQEHAVQTAGHVTRLERVFAELGEPAKPEASQVLTGLRRTHDLLVERVPDPPLRDLVIASSAAHTEHYEISAYHSALTLAVGLAEPELVKLLADNLREEEEALDKVEKSIPERLLGELAQR